MIRNIILIALLIVASISCSGGGASTQRCNNEECGDGMQCDNGVCIPEGCDGGTVCGSQCCSSNQECYQGSCVEKCEGNRCGEICCNVDEVCMSTGCCPEDKSCGDTCCDSDQNCKNNVCTDCEQPLCGQECCDQGENCLDNSICCYEDKICGDTCCSSTEECIDGTCIEICEGVRCNGNCCNPGEICENNECTTPCEGVQCDGLCCQRGEVCMNDSQCCFSTRVCGDICCDSSQKCNGEGECVSCDKPLCRGECCDESMVCFSGACCSEDRICGSVCCDYGDVCEGETCHMNCGLQLRCENNQGIETCCSDEQVCYMGECITPEVGCTYDGDCEIDEYCDEIISACLPIPESECEYYPPVGEFQPVVEWSWVPQGTYRQIMMTPAVANLTDDNGDSLVNLDDIPDIAVIAFAGSNYHTDGVMYVLSGDTGEVHYEVSPYRFRPGGGIAIGDVDNDAISDIAACGDSVVSTGLVILNNDGTLKWNMTSGCGDGYGHPLIVDLDADGTVEIVTDYRVFSNNAEICRAWNDAQRIPTSSDLDNDGILEVVGGNRAMKFNPLNDPPTCSVYWINSSVNDGYSAVADMNLDGNPEVVVVRTNVWILEGTTGNILWGPYPIPGGGSGGAPTVADFDGDERPEIATAGLDYYAVYDMDCTPEGDPQYCASGSTDGILWRMVTQDHSSNQTGSSVFDFEGDGKAEVIYNDEHYVRIYRGTDGYVLYQIENSSGTLFEYPLVVDVDNDMQSEIVIISNDYAWGPTRGVRVIGDNIHNWVRTRRIWNQHSYHVTNINEDGTVPSPEIANWSVDGLNNFRQNVQTYGVHNAPNIVPEEFFADDRYCPSTYILGVHVMNRGSRSVPSGLNVGFYEGDPQGEHTLIGQVQVVRPILSGGGEFVSIDWEVPVELQDPGRIFHFYVIVDDTTLGDEVANHECNEDDNISNVYEATCEIL